MPFDPSKDANLLAIIPNGWEPCTQRDWEPVVDAKLYFRQDLVIHTVTSIDHLSYNEEIYITTNSGTYFHFGSAYKSWYETNIIFLRKKVEQEVIIDLEDFDRFKVLL